MCALCNNDTTITKIWTALGKTISNLQHSSLFEAATIKLTQLVDHNVVVFSKYATTLTLFNQYITKHGQWQQARAAREVYLITGQTTTSKRREILAKIQQPKCPYILLMTIKVGGVGLNLVTASAAIFLDLQWNPSVEQQAKDRLHRIGQTKTVHIFRLITDLRIDQAIQQSQKRKSLEATSLLFGNTIHLVGTDKRPTVDELFSMF
jgi:SNF2 family DNA or RNA helicase